MRSFCFRAWVLSMIWYIMLCCYSTIRLLFMRISQQPYSHITLWIFNNIHVQNSHLLAIAIIITVYTFIFVYLLHSKIFIPFKWRGVLMTNDTSIILQGQPSFTFQGDTRSHAGFLSYLHQKKASSLLISEDTLPFGQSNLLWRMACPVCFIIRR